LSEAVRAERKGQRDRSLRIWSAGCASGAEPYTLAICLLEHRLRLRDWSLSILGTDISEEALRAAREAKFRPRAVEGVPSPQLKRYFRACNDDRWTPEPHVRELVTFERHNLMTPIPHPPFDCILIRNVLIYFDQASKRRVVENIIKALAPGGYLIVGPSEGIYDMLQPLERRRTFLYQQPRQHPPS
jgi:chemotaxis protein methyltransferase CheR